MEYLTKQQIILLALLVSFVSSIATGIVTVSLMEQGNQPIVTQTINRVVERTIEKVSPTEESSKESIKETIIVREDEAVMNAIEKVSNKIVRIYDSENKFIGIGVIVNSSGKIIAHLNNYNGQIKVVLDGGNNIDVNILDNNNLSELGLTILQPEQSNDQFDMKTYSPATLGDSDSIKLGQSIVLIAKNNSLMVESAIISSIDKENGLNKAIYSNIDYYSDNTVFSRGSIIINLSGEIIGIGSIPSNIIKTYATP